MTLAIPRYHKLMWPALTAFKQLGGSATVNELYGLVVQNEGFTEEQQAVVAPNGREAQIQYRLRWALTHLKAIGAANNTARGVWAITEHGDSLTEDQMISEHWAYRDELRRKRAARADGSETTDVGGEEEVDDAGGDEPDGTEVEWKDQLLTCLRALSPEGFERLSQLLLREAGFENVVVTGRSGDGGIDGKGAYRFALVSFPVFFQCKRYTGSVTAGEVRDFRGAMDGRGGNGLFITTGAFTRDARKEAARDGAKPIDLIDGTELCDLLRRFRLGVSVTKRVVEDIAVKPEFFDEYR
ncbi:restriction endonuclease [Allorhizocola rhizosphaerae]|uniref:restriction endonuclease n=1 Tax=Allorhizocola rhizosphaerae TaxID=1872709 RepID=UPI000E3D8F51|nr:restriction endonuclease [Allorhizocola rhizosphaerae]